MNQREIWEKIAPAWNKFRQKPMEIVLEFLKDKKGKILDLGCGSGRHLIKTDGKMYLVDFSESMIKFAKKNAKTKDIDAEFFVSEAEKLPFKNNFFDSAIYIAALHCIQSEKSREQSLRELLRVMKKDSEAMITVWSKNHVRLVNHPKDATITWKKDSEELQRYYYLYDKDELEELLKKIGFKIISINEDNKNITAIVRKLN